VTPAQQALVARLLDRHIEWLRGAIREQGWRWADRELDGYRTKSPERLAADRARAAQAAAGHWDELALALAARAELARLAAGRTQAP